MAECWPTGSWQLVWSWTQGALRSWFWTLSFSVISDSSYTLALAEMESDTGLWCWVWLPFSTGLYLWLWENSYFQKIDHQKLCESSPRECQPLGSHPKVRAEASATTSHCPSSATQPLTWRNWDRNQRLVPPSHLLRPCLWFGDVNVSLQGARLEIIHAFHSWDLAVEFEFTFKGKYTEISC